MQAGRVRTALKSAFGRKTSVAFEKELFAFSAAQLTYRIYVSGQFVLLIR